MKSGDLVKFAKSLYPGSFGSNACGIWLWKIGIVIDLNKDKTMATIYSENEIYYIDVNGLREVKDI